MNSNLKLLIALTCFVLPVPSISSEVTETLPQKKPTWIKTARKKAIQNGDVPHANPSQGKSSQDKSSWFKSCDLPEFEDLIGAYGKEGDF